MYNTYISCPSSINKIRTSYSFYRCVQYVYIYITSIFTRWLTCGVVVHRHAIKQQHALARGSTGLDLQLEDFRHRAILVREHWSHFDVCGENKESLNVCLV